jgi:hypothetical protein
MTREKLQNRRSSRAFVMTFKGRRYTVSFSLFDDGRVAEVFIDPEKVSNDLADNARDIAVLISIGCQHGAPISTMRDTLTRLADGSPSGLASAVLDELDGVLA